MAINCDWLPNLTIVSWLPLTQTFPPEPIYILYQRDSFPVRDTTHSSHSHVVLLSVHPLRAQRSGEQASGTQLRLIAINSDISSWAYIFYTSETLSLCETQLIPLIPTSCCSLFILCAHFSLCETQLIPLIPTSCCSLFILCAHRDQESRPPKLDAMHRDTCSVCGQLGFWGASSVTAHRRDRLLPADRERLLINYFVFFLVDVRGTALRTSTCIDWGPLLQATHYVD